MADRVVVVKLGSTSVTTPSGDPDDALLASLCAQVAVVRDRGTRVVVVSSGAVATGLAALGIAERPSQMALLQAASAVGQPRVVRSWQDALSVHGIVAGQVLLDPADLFSRRQYLLARATFTALLDQGVVPIVNENDAVADEEIRFGDNDRLAALVAVLLGATGLVMLTDTPGLLTADPKHFDDATLIEEVTEVDRTIEALAGDATSAVGTGGMASKLAAARLATWAGIETVVADARAEGILVRLEEGATGEATRFRARARPLAARKAWIAFATAPRGHVGVDAGAHRALRGGASLLLAGVRHHGGEFFAGDAVEVVCDGALVAKGLVRQSSAELAVVATGGPAPRDVVVVHHDDLVVLAERPTRHGTIRR
ncbi:MAG TPA: glutamate 5-kinase [Acidimicrobiales bacterium]|nr:glutamate 5-kinase [Acidimicrobiales bacterium]